MAKIRNSHAKCGSRQRRRATLFGEILLKIFA
jgi:hypothetical protein